MTASLPWMLTSLMQTPEGILLGLATVAFAGYRLLYKPYERAFPSKRF